MARYKHLSVKKVSLSDYAPAPKERALTPRQLAQIERDNELRAAMNEAAALPASEAVAIELKADQKIPTLRAAFSRILAAEPRELNWGVRGTTILISKGSIPGGPRRTAPR